MADSDRNNDEYQFADLDAIVPETGGEPAEPEAGVAADLAKPPSFDKNIVFRKVLIALGVFVVVIILYKSIAAVFSDKKDTTKQDASTMAQVSTPPQPIIQAQPQQAPMPTQVAPMPSSMSSSGEGSNTELSKKLATVELNQQNMHTDVSNVSEQLNSMSENMNTLVSKLTELNTVVTSLNAKLEEQSQEIERLTVRRSIAKASHHSHKSVTHVKYYLQAVIPGRAWLMAKNGATLTVREGSAVPGYGTVRVIDPNQGRVSTSTGEVIRFSQEDS
jgi:intracellular multiplication protein IcmG